MTNSDLSTNNETLAGERVLQLALKYSQEIFTDQIVAAYALGSLAHGGFDPLVSDIDYGLILKDPIHAETNDKIKKLEAMVKLDPDPLAQRLSVFWGSLQSLSEKNGLGRFPPIDLKDLAESGRLLDGQQIRDKVTVPTKNELVVSSAEFAIQKILPDFEAKYFKTPTSLLSAGVKPLTKTILFPIRFIYTARTGKIGQNHGAAKYFVDLFSNQDSDLAISELASAAIYWRRTAPSLDDHKALALLTDGLVKLYQKFLEIYLIELENYGSADLLGKFKNWQDKLSQV